MRPFQRAMTLAGFLCLMAFLLLASPGVRVVRAAGEALPEHAAAASGGSCNAAGASAAPVGDPVEAFLAQIRDDRPSPRAVEGQTVVLNSRGYNYGPPASPDLGLIELDARRQRRR